MKPNDALPKISSLPAKGRRADTSSHVALARLNQALAEHPRHTDLLIEAVPRLEAKDSSEIEGIVTTGSAMFRAAASRYALVDAATKEASAYAAALKLGHSSMNDHPISWRTAKLVASALMGGDMDLRRAPAPLKNLKTKDVVYNPPLRQDVLQMLLSDWERYGHRNDGTDDLTKAGLLHYQFVAIHPFADGNGRTARILHLLWLMHLGVLSQPVLYLSRFILLRRQAYYAALQAAHADATLKPILAFFDRVTAEAALWTLDRLHAVVRLYDKTHQVTQNLLPARAATIVADALFERPYCRIMDIVRTGVAKPPTAAKYMQALVQAHMLQEYRVGPEKIFAFPELESALGA